MDQSNNYIFEAYYFNQMSEKDKKALTKRLSEDPCLDEEYKKFSQIMGGVLNTFTDDNFEISHSYGIEEEYKVFLFIHGDLDKKESEQIQKRIKREPDYAQFIEEQKEMIGILDSETPNDIIEYVRSGKPNISFGTEIQTMTASAEVKKEGRIVEMPRRSNRWLLGIAASFLALLSIGSWWWVQSNNQSDNLAQTYRLAKEITKDEYKKMLAPSGQGFGTNADGLAPEIVTALKALLNNKPLEAERAILPFVKEHPKDLKGILIAANLVIDQKEVDVLRIKKAIEQLKTVSFEDDNIDWSLARAYLLIEDAEYQILAKTKLESIANSGSPYSKVAQEILNDQF